MFLLVKDGGADTEMSDDLAISLLIAHLVSGVACMNFFSHLSCDLDLLRGKVGCRPGAFLMYFGCRYLSVLSILTTLIYFDIFSAVRVDALNWVCQGAAGLSFGFASCIIIARTCTLFPNRYLCAGLEVVQLGFWGVIIASLGYTTVACPTQLYIRIALSTFLLSVSTCAITAALVHACYLSRHEHHYGLAACWRTLVRDNVPELALIWAASVSSTIVFLFDVSTSNANWNHFTLAYSTFVIITLISCRLYRKMLEQFDFCPVVKYSKLFGWIKISVVYVLNIFRFTGVRCLSFFRRIWPRDGESCPTRRTGILPNHTTTSILSSGSRPSGRKPAGKPPNCIPARSRSTYAQSSLYTSREG